MTTEPETAHDSGAAESELDPGLGPAARLAFEDQAYRAAVVDLLGAIAYGEMSAFERLAYDARMAPGLADKAALAKMAAVELFHFERLRDYLELMGADAAFA